MTDQRLCRMSATMSTLESMCPRTPPTVTGIHNKRIVKTATVHRRSRESCGQFATVGPGSHTLFGVRGGVFGICPPSFAHGARHHQHRRSARVIAARHVLQAMAPPAHRAWGPVCGARRAGRARSPALAACRGVCHGGRPPSAAAQVGVGPRRVVPRVARGGRRRSALIASPRQAVPARAETPGGPRGQGPQRADPGIHRAMRAGGLRPFEAVQGHERRRGPPPAERVDRWGRPRGQLRQGALADRLACPPCLAQEERGTGGPRGPWLSLHGPRRAQEKKRAQGANAPDMGTTRTMLSQAVHEQQRLPSLDEHFPGRKIQLREELAVLWPSQCRTSTISLRS